MSIIGVMKLLDVNIPAMPVVSSGSVDAKSGSSVLSPYSGMNAKRAAANVFAHMLLLCGVSANHCIRQATSPRMKSEAV